MQNIFSKLNKQQQQAVEHTNGPSIILAGAGSGKTRVLGYRAMYLLTEKKVAPENILMLTFTNKAAHEMKQRIGRYIDTKFRPEKITATTFHSFGALILRRFGLGDKHLRNFVIYDTNDQKDLMKQLFKDSQMKLSLTVNSMLYRISLAKNSLLTPKQLLNQSNNTYDEAISHVYQEYQNRLRQNNAVDFDDLLNETVYLFQNNPQILAKLQDQYQYLLIDEYQDTNHAQYLIAKLLAEKNQRIAIVGDFSQSIYSWRGADFRNLQKFKKDFENAQTFNLEENYRSSQPILDFAYDVISKNTTHPILKLWTNKKIGEEVEIVPLDKAENEAQFVINKIQESNFKGEYSLADFAILYRTNAQSRIFEEMCLHYSLPYRIYGGTRFYDRKEIKDIIAFLKYLNNPLDKVSLGRIEKLGKKRGSLIIEQIKKLKKDQKPQELIQFLLKHSPYLQLYNETDSDDVNRLENIEELVNVSYSFGSLQEFLDSVSLIESGYEFEQEGEKIHLLTLHAAKGLEFEVVFIVGVEEGILPHSRSVNSLEELEEERRLFYVGITRAKSKLYLTYTKERRVYGRLQYNLPSQFLGENQNLEF